MLSNFIVDSTIISPLDLLHSRTRSTKPAETIERHECIFILIFLRFMHGKKKKKNKDCDDEEIEEESQVKKVPTRDELLMKLEKLKVGTDEEFYDGVIDENDESWNSEDYSSDDEEE
ncbi:CLUMA_CG017152, isoform A [Clunio marinus]|uniref:CLUMA_CG017152, isoform A n=1 Tax=Clunio marinus TaxID=568069 RepID=A0A1J1IUW0_9DIPT|nr:CLUMA_CG017152, isoform A [Clunio marinus]